MVLKSLDSSGFCKYLKLVLFQPRHQYSIIVNVLQSEDHHKILEIQSEMVVFDARGGGLCTLQVKIKYFRLNFW